MRLLVALFVLATLPALGQQSGTVQFDPPNTGGPVTGYRLYRDGTLIGPVTGAQQTIASLFPSQFGSWTYAIETLGPGCGTTPLPACPRVSLLVPIVPPAPGPVRNLQICVQVTPPVCFQVVAP